MKTRISCRLYLFLNKENVAQISGGKIALRLVREAFRFPPRLIRTHTDLLFCACPQGSILHGFLENQVFIRVFLTRFMQECVSPFIVPATTEGFKSEGPYSLARHPMYGGMLLCSAGFSLVRALEKAIIIILFLYI